MLLDHGFEGGGKAEACVRKQDIEAPISVSDFLEDAIRLTERPQVGAQREYLASDVACRSIQAPPISAGDDNLRTFRGKQLLGFKARSPRCRQ